MVYLKTCCTGPLVVDHLDAAVDEALLSGTWLDVMVRTKLLNGAQLSQRRLFKIRE